MRPKRSSNGASVINESNSASGAKGSKISKSVSGGRSKSSSMASVLARSSGLGSGETTTGGAGSSALGDDGEMIGGGGSSLTSDGRTLEFGRVIVSGTGVLKVRILFLIGLNK